MLKGRKQTQEHIRARVETRIRNNSYKGQNLGHKPTNLKPNSGSFRKGIIPHNKGIEKYIDIDKIKYEYLIEEKSTYDIGLELGVNQKTIELRLKRAGIKLRTRGGYTDNFRKKVSSNIRGIKLEDWDKFISFEPYDEKFNNYFKNLIRERDNNECMLCGIHQERLNSLLSIHHIDYNKLNSIKENCISLCGSCHTKTNANRIHWTKFFQSILSERYGYKF